jgi:hypothetical protein
MSKKHSDEWEADLTRDGTSRPGDFAAEKAVESLHGGTPRHHSESRTRPGHYAAERAVDQIHADEEAHWQSHYTREPYHQPGRPYEYYARAYQVGYQGRTAHRGKRFEDVAPALEAEYSQKRGDTEPEWHDIRSAVRAAWDRLTHRLGDKA